MEQQGQKASIVLDFYCLKIKDLSDISRYFSLEQDPLATTLHVPGSIKRYQSLGMYMCVCICVHVCVRVCVTSLLRVWQVKFSETPKSHFQRDLVYVYMASLPCKANGHELQAVCIYSEPVIHKQGNKVC